MVYGTGGFWRRNWNCSCTSIRPATFSRTEPLCHPSKVFFEWFRERPNITLIDWPGNSPDLNPIENCWAWMKAQLENCKATSIPLLKVEILRLWTLKMDDSQYLRNLVESMPRRLQAVLESGGNATKY